MKTQKIICCCVTFILLLSILTSPVSAFHNDLFSFALETESLETLQNSELYKGNMTEFNAEVGRVVRLYFTQSTLSAEESLDDQVEKQSQLKTKNYLVFGNDVREIRYSLDESGNESIELVNQFNEKLPKYVEDLQNLKTYEFFFGELCKIEEVYCFGADGRNSMFGVCTFFVTDQGTFVKYYNIDINKDDAILLTEKEHVFYQGGHIQFLRDHSVDPETGELILGVSQFFDYMKQYYPDKGVFEKKVSPEEIESTDTEAISEELSTEEGEQGTVVNTQGWSHEMTVICILLVVVLSLVLIVFILLVRKPDRRRG